MGYPLLICFGFISPQKGPAFQRKQALNAQHKKIEKACAWYRSLSAEDTHPNHIQQVSWLAYHRPTRLLAFAMAFAVDSSLTVTGSLRIYT